MSCLSPNYNPNPTYIGHRVENRCQYDIEYLNNLVYFPSLKINVPISDAPQINQMLAKGNILQYKKNSSNLTKNQKYSQIAKGNWINRTKTYATQSQTYTNPNTNYLKKVNVPTNITLSGLYTNLPITCTDNPESLNPSSTVINDGGTLLCNSVEIPCIGYSYTNPTNLCQPSTSSNIPLPLTYLCYNTGSSTYYPRQRRTMNTSLSKWPTGAKGLCRSANSLQSENCQF